MIAGIKCSSNRFLRAHIFAAFFPGFLINSSNDEPSRTIQSLKLNSSSFFQLPSAISQEKASRGFPRTRKYQTKQIQGCDNCSSRRLLSDSPAAFPFRHFSSFSIAIHSIYRNSNLFLPKVH